MHKVNPREESETPSVDVEKSCVEYAVSSHEVEVYLVISLVGEDIPAQDASVRIACS